MKCLLGEWQARRREGHLPNTYQVLKKNQPRYSFIHRQATEHSPVRGTFLGPQEPTLWIGTENCVVHDPCPLQHHNLVTRKTLTSSICCILTPDPFHKMREWRFRTFRHLGCRVAEPGLESAGSAWLQTFFLLPVECGWCPVLRGGGVWSSGPGQREGRRNGPGEGAEG